MFRVRNPSGYPVNYTWDIAGGGANGSGTAQPGDNFGAINTGTAQTATVRLFVDGQQHGVKATRQNCSTLTIIKEAAPADGTDFLFVTQSKPLRPNENSPLPATFTLDDASGLASDETPGDDGDGFASRREFGALFGGVYTVTETLPAGWALENVACEGAASQRSGAGVTLTLDNGATATCTFSNRQQPATLVVQKQVTTAAASAAPPPAFQFDFALSDGATVDEAFALGAGGTQSFSLPPGRYALGETIVDPVGARFTPISAACDNGEMADNVSLAAGQTVSCTFVNEYNFQPLVPVAQCPSGTFDVTNPNGYPVTFGWQIEGEAISGTASAQPGLNPKLLDIGPADGHAAAARRRRAVCQRGDAHRL